MPVHISSIHSPNIHKEGCKIAYEEKQSVNEFGPQSMILLFNNYGDKGYPEPIDCQE